MSGIDAYPIDLLQESLLGTCCLFSTMAVFMQCCHVFSPALDILILRKKSSTWGCYLSVSYRGMCIQITTLFFIYFISLPICAFFQAVSNVGNYASCPGSFSTLIIA